MFGRLVTLVTLAAAIVLLFILQSTNPSTAGPAGILIVFFLIYIISFGIISYALYWGSWLLKQAVKSVATKKPLKELTFTHASYIASIIAMTPVMLLGMSSVGKLGFYEIALVLFFLFLGVIYVEKRVE